MTEKIEHEVDKLLLEHGEYLPLELLLRTGCLTFGDYEAWRSGELNMLAEALYGDPGQVQHQLRDAEDYLRRRGWRAESIVYASWPGSGSGADDLASSRPLRFSANEAFDRCFHRRYRKPSDQTQMDLFTDAPATSLVNTVALALADRNPDEARRGLERLYDTAPDHPRLGELERLVEAAEGLAAPVNDVGDELRQLRHQLTPLADGVLGPNSRNLLVPLWRRLSAALHDRPYRVSHPDLHLSYTAARAMEWEMVRRAVEKEAGWRTDPVLLRRHAEACEHLRDRTAALQSWFELCWWFPAESSALETAGNPELRRQWLAFLELDPELPGESFPAWLLLDKPGLTRILPEPADDRVVCPASYRLVYRLQHQRLSARTEPGRDCTTLGMADDVALRAGLKREDPVLFQYFLRHIEQSA